MCSIALGTGEVFPLEMATAFATLAAQGEFCQPYAISRIETRDGELLYEHTPDCEQAIDQEIARRVIDIMRGPVTAGGTADRRRPQPAPGARPGPRRTTATRGSSATCRSWPQLPGSATRTAW